MRRCLVVALLPFLLSALSACSWFAVPESPAPPPQVFVVSLPTHADRAVLYKSERMLILYSRGEEFARFPVALGRNPVGAKTCLGDYRTPEGHYRVVQHRSQSRFYKALKLSYPSAEDRARASARGCSPGGDVMIHGLENGYQWVGKTHLSVDWTDGCVAVTNEELDQLWRWLPDGTAVEIRP